eukprot:TRINITY_DN25630_c0_g1_i7.p1 TRINITY_DN25630_c0_g1~~TRINITY_DN25630_c0_g1_i7.p1  ORF type:complete len:494 (+),score=53.79 TRINITY_DN25630_c0_g1_i7:102-1583(+)
MPSDAAASQEDLSHLTCPICLEEPLLDPVTPQCGHSLDLRCYELLIVSRRPACPICRGSLSRSEKLQPSVALRACIDGHYGEAVQKRREEPIWQELNEGRPSKSAITYLLDHLKVDRMQSGGCSSLPTAVQMLLVLCGALTREDAGVSSRPGDTKQLSPEVRDSLVPLSEAVWARLSSPLLTVHEAENLLRAVQELGEAAPSSQLARLTGLVLEQGQLQWAVAENGAASTGQLSDWHRTVVVSSALEALLRAAAERRPRVTLSKAHIESAAALLGEHVSKDCATSAEEEQQFIASEDASTESLRASIFDAISHLLLIGRLSHAELSSATWSRLKAALRDCISNVDEAHPGFAAVRAACRACGSLLETLPVAKHIDSEWTAKLAQGLHRQLEGPTIIGDDATARHLLSLLGDVYSIDLANDQMKGAYIPALVGPEGRLFHVSISFALSAAQHADGSATPRALQLRLGALEALVFCFVAWCYVSALRVFPCKCPF